ncbi:T9SS type A sorting domain-containing protein [Bacteroidota bacterium]
MKTKNITTITLIIAVTILLSIPFSVMISQEKPNREKFKIFKELRDELKEFAANEIIPELNQWKTQLDNSMSKEDLDKLNQIRSKAAEIRNQSHKEMRNLHKNRKDRQGHSEGMGKGQGLGKGEGQGLGRGEGQGRRMMLRNQKLSKKCQAELREITGELQLLAEKYSVVLNKIVDDAFTKKEEWKNQTENIIENWKKENEDILNEMRSKDVKRRMHKPGFFNDFLANGGQERAVARFMLWDGKTNFLDEGKNMTINPEDDIFLNIDDNEFMSLDNEVRNSPNPFSEKTIISFNLSRSEHVKVTITDSRGKSVAVLVNRNLSEGRHDIEFNVTESKYSNLANGTYLYKIETQSFSKTGKMMLKK